MKKRDIILFIGVVVASIIGTKSFADPVRDFNSKEGLGSEEAERIIKSIRENPEFSMFYEAVEASLLAEEIAKLDEMTLMIPSNKAFKLLPGDVWENFMEEENIDALVELLNYHIIPEKVNYDDLNYAESLITIQGQRVNISHGDELKIENAVVVEKYEESTDVIIYKIDRLIMPLD